MVEIVRTSRKTTCISSNPALRLTVTESMPSARLQSVARIVGLTCAKGTVGMWCHNDASLCTWTRVVSGTADRVIARSMGFGAAAVVWDTQQGE